MRIAIFYQNRNWLYQRLILYKDFDEFKLQIWIYEFSDTRNEINEKWRARNGIRKICRL